MANRDLREKIQKAGIYHYDVAHALGISQSTLCVWLRFDLDKKDDRRERIEKAIEALINDER